MNPSNFSESFFTKPPWENIHSTLWPASLFTLRRNLKKYPFPHQQSETEARLVSETIRQACSRSHFLKDPIFLNLAELTAIQKEFIYEHFFVPEGIVQDRLHQGLIFDASGTFVIGINLSNHLTLHKIDFTSSWHEAWGFLSQADHELSQHLDYAFCPKFGFLTSDLRHCGTGLTLNASLHLPALLQLEMATKLEELVKNEDILITPMQTSTAEHVSDIFEGDLVVLQNRFHLGVKEDSLLHHLYNAATQLVNLEKSHRIQIKAGDFPEIKDAVSRSFGLLLHSYQLPTSEAFMALSFLKLGADLGWVKGISDKELNNLLFRCRRGHLLMQASEELPHDKILHKRASTIHSALKDTSLTFDNDI
ncbi:MAG: hypothetical protein FJZ63_06195 [Chlamydiae bacterium]|nr:hypothetical protein [Chlamydiota bacterium]